MQPGRPCWADGLRCPDLDGLDPVEEARKLQVNVSEAVGRGAITVGVVDDVFALVQLALDDRYYNIIPRVETPLLCVFFVFVICDMFCASGGRSISDNSVCSFVTRSASPVVYTTADGTFDRLGKICFVARNGEGLWRVHWGLLWSLSTAAESLDRYTAVAVCSSQ